MHLRSPEPSKSPPPCTSAPLDDLRYLFPFANFRVTPPILNSNNTANSGSNGEHSTESTQPIPSTTGTVSATGPSSRRLCNETLNYDVVGYSSYSSDFHPNNIKVNQPVSGRSRWSSEFNDQRQYLILKLERPSLLHSITLGKFSRKHVCNLKEFRVLAAPAENQWIEVLHLGVRDNSEPETFTVRHTLQHSQIPFPVLWVKIIPMMTYDIKFNFSIWYVELHGIQDPQIMQPLLAQYRAYCERISLRFCLKVIQDHLACDSEVGPLLVHELQSNVKTSNASALLGDRAMPLQLEDPIVSELRNAVHAGHFDQVEDLLTACQSRGLFDDYLQRCPYTSQWERIPINDEHCPWPGPRGGHQMCVDNERGHIYLFGGWNGTHNLSDFWRFDMQHSTWTLLSEDTVAQGGPRGRSCHTMCLCPQTRIIYILGRYVDPKDRGEGPLENDFYGYDIDHATWNCLSLNTELDGGPRLSFDFDLAVDSAHQHLYVFGGRILVSDTRECQYSGLYRYDIQQKSWVTLRPDIVPQDAEAPLRSRMEASLLYDPRYHQLLIISAQGESSAASEFAVYDIANDTVYEKVDLSVSKPIVYSNPFTHRATFDPNRQEVYIFTGEAPHASAGVDRHTEREFTSTLWCYHLPTERWTRVFSTSTQLPSSSDEELEISVSQSRSDLSTLGTAVDRHSTGQGQRRSSSPSLAREHDTQLPFTSPRVMLSTLCPRFNYYSKPLPLTRHCKLRKVLGKSSARAEVNPLETSCGVMTMGQNCIPEDQHPQARNAHHWVYHEGTHTHYLFGGATLAPVSDTPDTSLSPQPGSPTVGQHYFSLQPIPLTTTPPRRKSVGTVHRLNDLWRLRLVQPSLPEVVTRALFLVRRQRYLELCLGRAHVTEKPSAQSSTFDYQNAFTALQYLQQNVIGLVDQMDAEQTDIYQRLASAPLDNWPQDPQQCAQIRQYSRVMLFEDLLAYLPDQVKQPTTSLVDGIVPWLENQASPH
ncbi:hypothetical protein IWQ62_002060 [Dispira parvispora]|uniref:Muskelin N-terminal domain-containing protein n=1 Tax=Dispira parvispora TaxID=1520584 RepID=A0A9W8AUN5_9FUNG|nr:hypothetical protein IWQ62_002060 [Dispira parvispora]